MIAFDTTPASDTEAALAAAAIELDPEAAELEAAARMMQGDPLVPLYRNTGA